MEKETIIEFNKKFLENNELFINRINDNLFWKDNTFYSKHLKQVILIFKD